LTGKNTHSRRRDVDKLEHSKARYVMLTKEDGDEDAIRRPGNSLDVVRGFQRTFDEDVIDPELRERWFPTRIVRVIEVTHTTIEEV
jgi:hypothetical protein